METILNQLRENEAKLKAFRLGDRLTMKAAGTMLESTNVTGAGMASLGTQLLDYIPIKAEHNTSLLDYFPKVQVNSRDLAITNELNDDGTVSSTAEGDAKNLIDKDDVVSTPTMTTFTAYVNISRQMLDDVPFMNDQINRVLRRRLKNEIAEEFLKAIVAATPTYAAANLTAGTGGTTYKDCLPAVSADMQRLAGYSMNLWLLDQPPYGKLFAEVGQNYLWYALNSPRIEYCKEVSTANLLGLDTSMFPLYIYQDIDVTIGHIKDDFTKNKVTIVGEARVTWSLAGNCLRALYNDSFANTLAAIA